MASRLLVLTNFLAAPVTRHRPEVVGPRRVARVVLLALALLLAIETVLQVRSHFQYGASVFNLLFAETRYLSDEDTGLQLLRPNRVFTSDKVILRTNSLGLRSPEIPLDRPPGSWRVAVLGASTVMGAYDPDTEQTFPGRLEQRLRKDFPDRHIEVVNAGIVGYTLKEQRRMLETLVARLHPDVVVAYTGFNDFLDYCQPPAAGGKARNRGLPMVSLPDWLVSPDLVKKNTVFLRTPPVQASNKLRADAIAMEPYRAKLESLVRRAQELGLPLAFATNARAYRPDQPLAEQMKLSETDRYYNHCFDLEALHRLYDRHNAEIRSVAADHGIPVLPLDELIPGGPAYFADSHHFSVEGEARVGNALARFLVSHKLLPD